MNIDKLKPWNWFKHESAGATPNSHRPVSRQQAAYAPASAGEPLNRLHGELDRFFDDIFGAFGMPVARSGSTDRPGAGAPAGVYTPQIDVSGDEKTYQIALDVPGLKESDIDIHLSGDVLTIRGQKGRTHESEDKHYYRVERSFGAFQRTLSLPDDADAEGIEADLEQGVLRLNIPRRDNPDKEVKNIPIGG